MGTSKGLLKITKELNDAEVVNPSGQVHAYPPDGPIRGKKVLKGTWSQTGIRGILTTPRGEVPFTSMTAVTAMSSPRSANRGGSFRRELCAIRETIVGGALVAGAPRLTLGRLLLVHHWSITGTSPVRCRCVTTLQEVTSRIEATSESSSPNASPGSCPQVS